QAAASRSKRDELSLLSNELSANRELIAQSEASLSRMERYRDYVPLERLEQARADLQLRRIAMQQGLARQRQLQSDTARLDADIATSRAEHDAREAERRRDLGSLANTYELRRSDTIIAAPIDGTVQFAAVYVGNNIQADDVAMVVAGKNPRLRAQMRIPSRRRGFVRAGQQVRLKFDAFPYARSGSYAVTIASVSDNALPVEAAAATPGASTQPQDEGQQYVAWADLPSRVFVANGRSYPILPGMRATASVVIERRTIAQWVLAPLFEAVRG
ncbi:MAG TPA: HlyD family efflux transporter periplasmic adaptor subunit, partial [Lysobacter sp.]